MQFSAVEELMLNLLFGSVLVTKLDRLGTYAAAMAYCLVLSLVPFLLVTFTLATRVGLNLSQAYNEMLLEVLPKEINPPQIIATIEASAHGSVMTIGFILAVYTSYNLMTQIVRTLLFIFDDPRRPQGWNWSHWVKSGILLFIWMVLLLAISITSVMYPVIHNILKQFNLDSVIWTLPLAMIQYALVLAAMYGAFFLTFLLVPTKRPGVAQARNGSLVATCGWILCGWLFAGLLPKMILSSGVVYKALGSVVIILLWAQACSWSVIIGACWMVRFPARRKLKVQVEDPAR